MKIFQRGFLFLLSAGSALLFSAAIAAASSEKLTILYSFCSPGICGEGEDVPNPVISDSRGNLFGTTIGGTNLFGSVYELRRRSNGSYKHEVLHVFDQVIDPIGALVMDTKGNLYGVAEGLDGPGDYGQIFELSPQKHGGWIEKTLYAFCPVQTCKDGAFPPVGLTYANQQSGALYDGKSPLFGVTREGGKHSGGTVFELRPGKKGWTHDVLYNFCSVGINCADGTEPEAQLLLDASGNLFGVTTYGGTHGGVGALSGTAFELSPAGTKWTETVLHSFCTQTSCADGAFPKSPLAFGSDGNLYGFTVAGGAPCVLPQEIHGCGVAYKIVPDGANSQEAVLYNFCTQTGCQDGAAPESAPVFDGIGNLYGTALIGGDLDYAPFKNGGGTVFQFSLADPKSTFRVLHSFCQQPNCSDGDTPLGFIGDPGTTLIGVTSAGGKYQGGAVFSLTSGNTAGSEKRK